MYIGYLVLTLTFTHKFKKNDSEYLANRFPDSEVIAIDISPTAIENCKRENKIDNLKFIEVDFFNLDLDLGSFDFIFDQTFFCAIDPKIRKDWGKKMKEIVGLNGYLLTVIYPLPRDASQDIDLTTGPPFEVNFASYENVLKPEFECVARWGGEMLPISNEKRRGREQLALWQRKIK